jgi:competence protein ComEC
MLIRIFCTFAFMAGLLAPGASRSALLAGACAVLLLCLWHPRLHRRRALLLLLAVLLGWGRAALDRRLDTAVPVLKEGKMLACGGTVVDSPRQWGASLVFFLQVERVQGEPLDRPALLLVRWSGGEDAVLPGERWELTGRFSQGEPPLYPGGFSQGFWLWTQRAQGTLKVTRFCEASFLGPPRGCGPRALAARLRQRMLARLAPIADDTARALVCGVVFGDTQALPRQVQDQFRRTGTSHLLAASGMNVALLVGLFAAAARLLGYGPWRIAPAMIPLAVAYAFLAGCAPSISRAAAAAVVGLTASWLGRSSGPWNSLCLSIWALLLWEPRQIYDVGFQLSVAAVVGLIAGPTLDESASGWKKSAVMTVSACLLTLPLVWSTFHQLSLTLLPANLILGPVVELLFPLGLLLTALPLPPLYWLVEAIARLSLFLVGLLSKMGDPVPLARPGAAGLLLLAMAIALWVGIWRWPRWLAIPLAVAALLLGRHAGLRARAAPGELVIRRIGRGDSVVYWLSCQDRELLVLSQDWQESRARAMLLDMGCSRAPQVRVQGPDSPFAVRWGAFRWGRVYPLLAKAPYLEVRTTGCTYSVRPWRPDHENRDSAI